jgi:hypothetical protein
MSTKKRPIGQAVSALSNEAQSLQKASEPIAESVSREVVPYSRKNALQVFKHHAAIETFFRTYQLSSSEISKFIAGITPGEIICDRPDLEFQLQGDPEMPEGFFITTAGRGKTSARCLTIISRLEAESPQEDGGDFKKDRKAT